MEKMLQAVEMVKAYVVKEFGDTKFESITLNDKQEIQIIWIDGVPLNVLKWRLNKLFDHDYEIKFNLKHDFSDELKQALEPKREHKDIMWYYLDMYKVHEKEWKWAHLETLGRWQMEDEEKREQQA